MGKFCWRTLFIQIWCQEDPVNAFTAPISRWAFNIRLEPPLAKSDGSTAHTKKRLEMVLVLFLNKSIKQLWCYQLHIINFFHLFIEGNLLYRILLFSVKPQHESAIGIHISLPFWTCLSSPSPFHPSRLIQSPCMSFLAMQQIPVGYLFYIW